MGFSFGNLFKGLAGALPVVGPLATGLFAGLQGGEANKAELGDREMWNQFLAAQDKARGDVMGGLTAAGQNPFAGLTSSSTGTNFGTTASNSRTNFNNIMRKLVDPAQAGGKAALEGQVFDRLGKPAVTEGEMMRKLAMETKLMDIAERSARDKAGIRGMGPGQAMGGTIGMASDRAGRLLDTLAARPELERKRQFENENAANQLLNAWQGQSTAGKSRTSGTTSSTGGSTMSQQNAPDMRGLFSMLAPTQPGASMETGYNPWLEMGQNVSGALPQMFPGQPKPPMTMPTPGSTPLMNPWQQMFTGGK